MNHSTFPKEDDATHQDHDEFDETRRRSISADYGYADNEGRSPFGEFLPSREPSRLVIDYGTNRTFVYLNSVQRHDRDLVAREVLYKELKHKHQNTFERFIISIICLLIPALFCHGFAFGTTEWIVIAHRGHFQAIGMFSMCRDGVVNFCLQRGSPLYAYSLEDFGTNQTICEMKMGTARRYIGFLWSLTIIQSGCVLLSFMCSIRMACRPTRSTTATITLCAIGIAVLCGISTCVVFHFYVRCARRSCNALRRGDGDCHASYEWGYKVHIAATVMDFFVFIICIFLASYPRSLREYAATFMAMRRERGRQARERAEAAALAATNGKESAAADGRHNTPEVHRRTSSFLSKMRQIRGGGGEAPPYLTASELGVTIEGADDWVYDVKSDLFYSFKLDAFWDPLTPGYYSRALRMWQPTPEGLSVVQNTYPVTRGANRRGARMRGRQGGEEQPRETREEREERERLKGRDK